MLCNRPHIHGDTSWCVYYLYVWGQLGVSWLLAEATGALHSIWLSFFQQAYPGNSHGNGKGTRVSKPCIMSAFQTCVCVIFTNILLAQSSSLLELAPPVCKSLLLNIQKLHESDIILLVDWGLKKNQHTLQIRTCFFPQRAGTLLT